MNGISIGSPIWDMCYRYRIWYVEMVIYHVDMVILDIVMGYSLIIWELTVSIWSSWRSIWDILSLCPGPARERGALRLEPRRGDHPEIGRHAVPHSQHHQAGTYARSLLSSI